MNAFATTRTAIFLLRSAFLAVLALLLAGCFMSRQPLITAQNAEFPFASGTVLKPYELSYENETPQFRDTGEPLITLGIDDGYYTDRKKQPTWFRLQRIQGSPNYLIMLKIKNGFSYALVEQVRSSFIIHTVTADNFSEYKKYMKENDPYVWRSFSSGLQELAEGKAIQFESLESATTVLPHVVSRGFSSASSAYKIIDKPSRERDAGRRGSKQDNATAPTEMTQNAQRVQTILKNMEGNQFVSSKGGEDRLTISIDRIHYLIVHNAFKPRAERCTFLEMFRNDEVSYVDVGCDGSPNWIRRQDGGDPSDNITPEERRKFSELLTRVMALSKITLRYKSVAPQGQFMILPDVSVINRNARLMQKVFDVAITIKSPDENGLLSFGLFGGITNKVQLVFAAKVDGDKVGPCTVIEDDELTFWDANCDGRFESFAKTKRGLLKESAFGNDKVVNAMLEDLARFTDFAVKYHLR